MKHNFNSISQVEKDRILEMHIRRVLEEQATTLDVGGNFQKGQNKTLKSGEGAGLAFRQTIANGLKTAKEGLITIGKTLIKTVIFAGATIFVIGEAIFKVNQAIANAIIKFLTSCGKAVINTGKQIGKSTIDVFTKVAQKTGQAIKSIGDFINGLADSAYKVIVYILKSLKQFGIMFWGKILVMASTVKEFGQNVWNWCKQQFTAISKQIGMAWDSAVNMAKQGWNAVKNLGSQAVQGAKNLANKAVDYGKAAANKVSDYAGQAYGAVKGFAQGLFEDAILFYETYISIRNSDTLALISECSKITKNVIL
jgi:hypothetical protein